MSANFCIPEEILLQHLAVLGKTGKGKSSVMRYVVEHLLRKKKRVCIIDPKGDWWGLKSSADGKGEGFPIIAFGDFKDSKVSDVPINGRSGKELATLVSTGNRPCMIGMSGWKMSAMTDFWIEFASTLFNSNRGELYLVGDEFHNFAPKGKILSPQAGECLHWSNRILSEGRGIGLVCMIASQRPQKVHNDTLTCCETLVAMGVNHPADRNAVKEWLDGAGDPEKSKLILNSLAGLGRGEAYVWSPENKFGPELIKFPKFETFDSFAPPQLQPKVHQQGWAKVDLSEVKSRLANVIEEAKANDPAALRQEVARLKKDLTLAQKGASALATASAKVEIKEVPVMSESNERSLANLEKKATDLEFAVRVLISELCGVRGGINGVLFDAKKSNPPHSHRPAPALVVRPTHTASPRPAPKSAHDPLEGVSFSELDDPQQKILDTVVMLENRGLTPNREMIAAWMSLHPNGGRFGSNLALLRSQGYLAGCEITDKGKDQAKPIDAGLNAARNVLDDPQRDILDKLVNGEQYDRESLAAALGIHPNGGRYGTNLRRLRTMGLIPERGIIKLTPEACG